MLFTIGYSNRTLPEFLHELNRRGITQIWDVRSSPWSRNNPFNAPAITRWTERAGILYRQHGNVLGGRSEIGLDDARYLEALKAMLEASFREPLTIMCAEGDPTHCHRTWDVGASLLVRFGVVARSILRNGGEEDITATLARVPASRIQPKIREALASQPDLFDKL